MRLTVSGIFLLLAILFPLLLNGQVFSCSLVGIGCGLVALVLTLTESTKANSTGNLSGRSQIIAGLAILLVAFLLVRLPSAYRYQRDFNRRSAQLRNAAAIATTREALLKARTAIATQKAQPSQANPP